VPEPIEDWVDAALVADVLWMRSARAIVFVSPSRDQVRAMIEAAAPLVAAAERERLSAAIPPERFRLIADWFDTDDEFKAAMFPETWTERGHETQDDLRKFASLLDGKESQP
jgi:hypothetical protein